MFSNGFSSEDLLASSSRQRIIKCSSQQAISIEDQACLNNTKMSPNFKRHFLIQPLFRYSRSGKSNQLNTIRVMLSMLESLPFLAPTAMLMQFRDIRRSACAPWIARVPPFPAAHISLPLTQGRLQEAYHLESVQLLLDLLSKQWCQTVTGGYISPSVVFRGTPHIVKLYPRTEADVSSKSFSWSPWQAAVRSISGDTR